MAFLTRGLLVALVAVAAVMLSGGRVSAASAPPSLLGSLPALTPQPGDYFFGVFTCTEASATVGTCGEVDASGPGAFGPPSSALLVCETLSGGQVRESFVAANFQNARFGTGSISGLAGVTSSSPTQARVFSFLFGTSHPIAPGFPGAPSASTSGSAIGSVTVNNQTGRVTSGSIRITITGTIFNFTAGTTSQGSMSCPVNPVGAVSNVAFASP